MRRRPFFVPNFRILFAFSLVIAVMIAVAAYKPVVVAEKKPGTASSKLKHHAGPEEFNLIEAVITKKSCCYAKSQTSMGAPIIGLEHETYKLTATYYRVRDGWSTTLMLNNKGAEPILATPTLYSMAGTPFRPAPIVVPAASYIDVNVEDMISSAGSEFREGSMKVAYSGIETQLGVQVKMVDASNGLIWAEQFVYTSKAKSSRLENVWWLPYDESDASVAVSNTSASSVDVTLSVDGTIPHQQTPAQVTLAPWETRLLDIAEDIGGRNNGKLRETGGISISHSGSPGSVLARMFIAKPNKRYSAAMSFTDPEQATSQQLSGLGLRLKNLDGSDLDQMLVVRNTSNDTSDVNGQVRYTDPSGAIQAITVPQFQVSAGSTKLVDLSNTLGGAPATVGYSGFDLDYSAPKGTLIASIQSVSKNGDQVFQVPIIDPKNIPATAAGFPWKVDGDFRTIIYAKNESMLPQKFATHLVYDGGQYSTGEREIQPGQTIAVDFRELRDNQSPDGLKRVIPMNVNKGQIAWTRRGGQSKSLSVRSEQISVSGGVASTYSCVNNCCDNRDLYGWADPDTIDSLVGEFHGLGGTKVEENCFQQQFISQIQNINWWSADTNVEAVTAATAEGVGLGQTAIYGDWDRIWYYYGPSLCEPMYIPEQEESEATVFSNDIIFTTVSNDSTNTTANFTSPGGSYQANVSVSTAHCVDPPAPLFNIYINFQLPYNATDVYTTSPKTYFSNGSNKVFEGFNTVFQNMNWTAKTGTWKVNVKKVRQNGQNFYDWNNFYISGPKSGGGAFRGGGTIHFVCP